MIQQTGKLKFWPRLCFSISPYFLCVIGIEKNILNIHWLPLFLILSLVVFKVLDCSIELHETSIKLTGPFFAGALREKPVDKIQFVAAFSNAGAYSYRIGFDPAIIRSKFWLGTDNLLILSPVFFDNTTEIVRALTKRNSKLRIDESVKDLLDGKKKNPEHVSGLLFGSLSVMFILVSIFIVKNKL
jgi:hypothetical protein